MQELRDTVYGYMKQLEQQRNAKNYIMRTIQELDEDQAKLLEKSSKDRNLIF